jgi:hypothetical protein
MGYGLDSTGSIPKCANFHLSHLQHQDQFGVPTQPPSQEIPVAFSLGLERQERAADYSAPSSAKVKKSRAITPLPDVSSWHGPYLLKHKENCAFYPLFTMHFVTLCCFRQEIQFELLV